MRHVVGALLVGVTLFALPNLASAGIVLPATGRDAQPLSIRHHHVRVEIDNQVAKTVVQQTFENHTDKPLDGTFYFELGPEAAVVDFVQWIGDERVASEMVEKEDAERKFEAGKAAGEAPALLQQISPDRFQAKVADIPAHGVRRTELTYSEVLPYSDGAVSYRYPFDMSRLYSGEIDNVSLTVVVKDQKLIKALQVDAPGQLVETTQKSANEWHAHMKASDLAPQANWDLTYEVSSREMGINFLTFREKGEDGYFVLMIAPQELTTDKDIVKKDVVFVFDRSGSMSGDKIRQARQALNLSLGYMNAGDRFGVVGFSSGVDPFRNKVLPASKKNLAEATRFVNGFSAGGGTNIHDALVNALEMVNKETERPSALIFLTDGLGQRMPHEVIETVDSLNERGTRIFAFGVGSDVNRQFLEELGSKNRGHAQFLADGVRIDDAVASFYSGISKPVLSDLRIDYGDVTSTMTYPATLPDIYKGQQVIIVGRYRGSGTTTVNLAGGLNGSVKGHHMQVTFPEVSDEYPFVPRLWAQRRIDYLLRSMRMHGENAEMKQEVIELAKAYRIVTPYTSFVSKRVTPQVASLTPARIKPGDPEIWIDAPADARRVSVHFPFGVTKRAVWDERAHKWVVRFLIPRNTPDGVYFVRIAVTDAAGNTALHTANYTVDTKPAALQVELASRVVAPGAPIAIQARAVVTPLELAEVAGVKPKLTVEAAKSLVDVKSVTAVTEDGRRVELDTRPDQNGWSGIVETRASAKPGTHYLTVYSIDVAGNVWGKRFEYEVVPTELALER